MSKRDSLALVYSRPETTAPTNAKRSQRARPRPLPQSVSAVPKASGAGASLERNSHASTAFAEIVDRTVHAATARFTVGLSPIARIGAYLDWTSHLTSSPGMRYQFDKVLTHSKISVLVIR